MEIFNIQSSPNDILLLIIISQIVIIFSIFYIFSRLQ